MKVFFDPGCAQITSILRPSIVASRLNKVGGVIRQGDRWFLSEYAMGYGIFEYANSSMLKHSRPSRVHWLQMTPHFDGTDNAVCEHEFFFYSSSSQHLYAMRLEAPSGIRSISLKRTPKVSGTQYVNHLAAMLPCCDHFLMCPFRLLYVECLWLSNKRPHSTASLQCFGFSLPVI